MKLRTKLTLLFAGLAVIPSLILSALAFHNGRKTIEQETISHLTSVNILKSGEIDRWVEDAKQSLQKLAQRPLLRRYSRVLSSHLGPDAGSSKVKAKLIHNHLHQGLRHSRFRELSVLCLKHGRILAATNSRQEGKYRENRPFFIEGRSRTYVQDIYFSAVLEEPTMTIGTPIRDRQGETLAVLAGRLDLNELSQIMEQGRGLRVSEDTYLVNAFNFFVTEPRFGEQYALQETVHTKGVKACLSGKDGMGFYDDYRGVPVIGAYRWLDKHRLGLITEIDQAVAYAPIRQLAWSTGLAAVLIIGVGAGLGLSFARSLTGPVRRLVAGTQEIGRGNLDYRVGTASRDEIGELSRAFDLMTEELQRTTVSRDRIMELNEELEQRVAERTAELEDSNAFRDNILRHSPAGILACQADGRCVLANESAGQMLDTSPEGLLNREIHAHPVCRALDLPTSAARCLQNGVATHAMARTRSTSGQERWLDCRCSSFRAGDTIYLLLILTDITELKKQEAELEKSAANLQEANKELEAFAYSVSHDLRAPLRAIDGYTRILEEDYQELFDDEGRRVLGVICSESERLGNLIDALLSYSRLGRTELRSSEIDMTTLAHSIFSELTTPEDRERIDFQAEDLPAALGDPTLIRQIWLNLIGNAIKYSSHRERARILISGECRPGETVYCVQDNGAGFDMQYADKLFGVFQRLHSQKEFEGTGVGLANVQRAVLRHNGRVWAEGETDKGAVFCFALPGS